MTFYINIKSFDYKHEQEFDNLESAKLKVLQTGFKKIEGYGRYFMYHFLKNY